MKRINAKDILIPTIALFLICLVVALLLSFTNELTKGPIAEQEKLTAQKAMQSVCSYASSFEEAESENEAYVALSADGKTLGYAIPVTVKGYGGDISIMVGISTSDEVTGVEILSHSETPGLGANCKNASFTDKFKRSISETDFRVNKDGGDIEAMTGATITSEAVTEGVSEAIDIYNSIKGGEN